MKRFYLKERVKTIAYQTAPALPEGFFIPKRKASNDIEQLEKEYNEQQANAFANVEDEQMLMTLKGGKF